MMELMIPVCSLSKCQGDPGSREGFHRAAGAGCAVLLCGLGSGVCDPPAPVFRGIPGGERPLVPALDGAAAVGAAWQENMSCSYSCWAGWHWGIGWVLWQDLPLGCWTSSFQECPLLTQSRAHGCLS